MKKSIVIITNFEKNKIIIKTKLSKKEKKKKMYRINTLIVIID